MKINTWVLAFVGMIFLSIFSPCTQASGGFTHRYVASEAVSKIKDPTLRHLLQDNADAYLVGAYYPDSGYVKGTQHGEDSHWDEFIYTFADYIKEKYSDPVSQAPQLLAFLFGCAAHRVSDEMTHGTFYAISAAHDFNGDSKEAHQYGDVGTDLLLYIQHQPTLHYPAKWWVPVKDLVAVYQRMGKSQYTAEQIVHGNKVISITNIEEKLIAYPLYPYLILKKMPWTAAHYYNWPQGGILDIEDKIAAYDEKLWKHIQQRKSLNQLHMQRTNFSMPTALVDFANESLEIGALFVPVEYQSDGSVVLSPPIIADYTRLNQLIAKITKWMMG